MTTKHEYPTEHQEQAALFEWAAWRQSHVPTLSLLFAIPNGGKRSKGVAGQLKAEGVKPGVPDICLPVARDGAHGLWIELKTSQGRTSNAQEAWLAALHRQGYAVAVCHGWQPAARRICHYLGLDPAEHGL